MRILTLDLAKTRSGVALYDEMTATAVTWNIGKSTPIELFEQLKGEVGPSDLVIIEEHKSFRNAKTTRILIELNGFVHWSFVAQGNTVLKLFPATARKAMKDQYTTIPDDERDALLLLHEHLGTYEALTVERKRDDEQKNINRKSTARQRRKRTLPLDNSSKHDGNRKDTR